MKVTGKITAVLSEASGVSKSGKPWRRREYIVTYDSSNPTYPKSIIFAVMGDKIDQFNIQLHVDYELEIDFTMREYNGRLFQSANCWKATPIVAQPAAAPASPSTVQQAWEAVPPPQTVPPAQEENLPF